MNGVAAQYEKGQALVVFLGFAAAMIGIMLVAFNSGQVTNAKMRAMNAADAAAYSGAVWQARSLNFQAYMNRAMVVNEVTIAQSVSLRSWIDYLSRFISNINMVTRWLPWLGTATTAVSKAVDQVDEAMQDALPRFETMARVLAGIEHDSQSAFNIVGPVGASEIAIYVAEKNGATVSTGGYALFATNATEWASFTETYTKDKRPAAARGDGRGRLRAVALDSRDGFTLDRRWQLDFVVGKLSKQGGTDLVNYDAWKGLDSAAMCTGIVKCPWLAMGWGGAQANSPPTPATGIGTHGNRADWNRVDGRRARNQANLSTQAQALTRAFPNYRDLQVLDSSKTALQKVAFAVEVVVADNDIPTAHSAFGARTALIDGSTIEHDPQYSGARGGVYGLAEACISFERPPGVERADGGVERPSLFNPYWRASLATPSRRTRGVVGIAKGLPPIEVLVGGGGSCE